MSEQQETFIAHLVELRDRLIRALLAIVIVFVCLMPWAGSIYDILAKPMMDTLPAGTNMIATGVVTPFFVPVKVTMMVAFVLALPWVLYQAWAFIAPGLYAHEKRFAIPFVMMSSIFFTLGCAFSHYVAFPAAWNFFGSFADDTVQFAPRIEPVFSLYVRMALGLGLVFEMPTLVMFLARVGLVTPKFLLKHTKYAILLIFVVAAIVTPGSDPLSLFLVAMPMIGLYGVSIGVAWLFKKRARTDP